MIKLDIIYESVTGSHLYGTNTPESDMDYTGVFIADEKYYFGLDKIEEVDMSLVSKRVDGKNDADAVDRKFYELRQFVRLALNNNPNIVELLFPPNGVSEAGSLVTQTSPAIQLLQSNAHLFLSKEKIYKGFLAYAVSQQKKMSLKPDNYRMVKDARQHFQVAHDKFGKDAFDNLHVYHMLNSGVDLKNLEHYDGKETHIIGLPVDAIKYTRGMGYEGISIGGLTFPSGWKLTKVVTVLDKRLLDASYRLEKFKDYGYDLKFGSHLIRLLFEGRSLLVSGILEFPLVKPEREIVLDVKLGKYSLKELQELAADLIADLAGSFESSAMPIHGDYNAINKLVMEITKNKFLK